MNRGVLESQAVKLHATYKIKFGSKKIRSNIHKHQSQVCLTFSKKKKKVCFTPPVLHSMAYKLEIEFHHSPFFFGCLNLIIWS